MWDIASSRAEHGLAIGWGTFAAVNVALMWLGPGLETIPFHLVWASLCLVYGLRAWRLSRAVIVCAVLAVLTGLPLASHARSGVIAMEEVAEIPLMSLIFLIVVWHVRRRGAAVAEARCAAERERVAIRLQERFVRLASHELRTPITVARGYTEMLRDDASDPRVVEDTAVVLDELHKLERMAGALHALAWAHEPGGAGIALVDVEVLAHRVVRRWAPVTRRPLCAEVAPAAVLGDEDRLETALDCLVENAVRHTGNRATIVVRAHRTGSRVVIEVEDDGPGVPEPARSGALDGRRDPADPRGGSGLGLAIVRGIVEAHRGEIVLGQGSGGGLRVTIGLPAVHGAVVGAAGLDRPGSADGRRIPGRKPVG